MTLLQSGITKAGGAYTIDQSCRFDDGDSPSLTKTFASEGDRKTWTFSAWIKLGLNGADRSLFTAGADNNNMTQLLLQDDDVFNFFSQTTSVQTQLLSTPVYRDPGAWYHIVCKYDSTPATPDSTDVALFVNGSQITALTIETYPSQDTETYVNDNVAHYISRRNYDDTKHWDGYIAEVYFIDGQALDADSFGETDDTTNQWKPIDASGLTFGTNGFYQKYAATELSDSFTDDSRKVNVFTADGTFTIPAGGVTADILIVAGGGGGSGGNGESGYGGSGAGAGGMLEGSSISLSAGTYTVTVGDGGSGGSYGNGTAGSNSVLTETTWGTATAIGGANGTNDDNAAVDGGSGGGGSAFGDNGEHPSSAGGGEATQGDSNGLTGYGYDGGFGYKHPSGYGSGGSGGGAGGVGGNAANEFTPGAIGPGRSNSIRAGTSVTYAAGGLGAATSGGGGGGAGGANTGTGGTAGNGGNNAGGAGGSGIVIVSYPTPSGETGGFHTITAYGNVANTRAVRKVGDSSIVFDGSGDYLQTPSSGDYNFGTGDFTLELWMRADITSTKYLITRNSSSSSDSADADFALNSDGGAWVQGTEVYGGSTPSTGVWIHYAVVRDSGTVDVYKDGTSVASTSATGDIDSSYYIRFGDFTAAWSSYFDGYLDEIRISNVARYDGTFTPETTAFTTDSNTMFLLHSNWDGGLGADSSGNYNTFTATNLAATDQMLDSPTNNFPTFNPLVTGGSGVNPTYSEGNLETSGTNSEYAVAAATFAVSDGKWYWEYFAETLNLNDGKLGIKSVTALNLVGQYPYGVTSDNDGTLFYNAYNGYKSIDDVSTSYGATFDSGDIIGIALDLDSGTQTIEFYKNNVSQGSITLSGGVAAADVVPMLINLYSAAEEYFNFGQDSSFAGNKTAQGNQDGNGIGDFYYAVPDGFLALCTSNLSDPSIALPSDHFNVVGYAGDGTEDRGVTGVGFQPDFTWIKEYEEPTYRPAHVLMDSVRGAASIMFTNTTEAEKTHPDAWTALWGWFDSFDSDGFSVSDGDNNGNFNASPNRTYESWNWKGDGVAGGTLNEDGTLDSQVNANTTAGFSIVGYTPTTGSATTVGHGLSQKPDLIIVKGRESALNWPVYQSPQGATYAVWLDDSGASNSSGSTGYWNDTEPTASVFTVGDSSQTGGLTEDYISYCFHSVEGYSKIGKFLGNNATDGRCIYLGFRPAYVMIKALTASADWAITDTTINPYNALTGWLEANTDDDLNTDGYLDFLSNGIKLRNNNAQFNAAQTYLYIAFAESPFKYSNAR